MVQPKVIIKNLPQESFYIRTLTKSGGSRYLSIGKILPEDWRAVKVFAKQLDKDTVTLKLVLIK